MNGPKDPWPHVLSHVREVGPLVNPHHLQSASGTNKKLKMLKNDTIMDIVACHDIPRGDFILGKADRHTSLLYMMIRFSFYEI